MRIINLLPKQEQDYLRTKKISFLVQSFVFWSAITYLIVALALIGGRIYFTKTLSGLDAEIAKQKQIVDQSDNVALQKRIDNVNNTVIDYNSLAASNPHWSKVLTAMAKMIPTDVYVTTFSSNTKTGKIDISGVGGSRDSVLALHSNLVCAPWVKSVDFPLENLQKARNATFHYTLYLADDILKGETLPVKSVNSTCGGLK